MLSQYTTAKVQIYFLNDSNNDVKLDEILNFIC
jgi:hypothetical protein